MKKVAFISPTEAHTLSEQECELITFYRSMSPTKQSMVLQILFAALTDESDKTAEREAEKGK